MEVIEASFEIGKLTLLSIDQYCHHECIYKEEHTNRVHP